MRKILYCEHNTDGTVGGSYYSLYYLVREIKKAGDYPIVVFYKDNFIAKKLKDENIEVYIFKKNKAFSSEIPLMGFLIQKIFNFFGQVIKPVVKRYLLLRKHKIDIVHLNNSILYNHDWIIASLLLGIKCISHERGINDHFPRFAKFLGSRLHAIIAISNAVKQNMIAHGVNGHNIKVVYNGLNPEDVTITISSNMIKKELKIEKADVVIGVVGNIKEWKGQKTIISAMVLLSEKIKNVKCLLVGDVSSGDAYYLSEIKKIINEHRLQNQIIITGFKKNIYDYMNAMDIAVHTSTDPEPFGRVLIEAMALRKPVIGTNIGAVPEIIVDGATGYTVPPGNAIILTEKLIKLIDNRKLRNEMGKKGYQRLVDKFHLDVNTKKSLKIYNSIEKNQK